MKKCGDDRFPFQEFTPAHTYTHTHTQQQQNTVTKEYGGQNSHHFYVQNDVVCCGPGLYHTTHFLDIFMYKYFE